jgi:hypothetical protein
MLIGAAPLRDSGLDVLDELGEMVIEVKMITTENANGKIRCRTFRPGQHFVVRGYWIVIGQESVDRAG